jgi:hypothetical protein
MAKRSPSVERRVRSCPSRQTETATTQSSGRVFEGPKGRRVTGDGSSSAQRSDKPGLERIQSCEVVEEVRNLKRVGAPAGEMPLTTDFETL